MLHYSHFIIILQEDVTQMTEGAGVNLELQSDASMQMVCISLNVILSWKNVSVTTKFANYCKLF